MVAGDFLLFGETVFGDVVKFLSTTDWTVRCRSQLASSLQQNSTIAIVITLYDVIYLAAL